MIPIISAERRVTNVVVGERNTKANKLVVLAFVPFERRVHYLPQHTKTTEEVFDKDAIG